MTQIIKNPVIAAEEILKGNVVAIPTETVYGLGANGLNPEAVLKIYEIKKRPLFNPLILHIDDIEGIKNYASNISKDLLKLAEKFSPGPITFVVRKKSIVPDIVTGGLSTVAIRIPSHKIIREVLKLTGVPIAAPSANIFGRTSPTTAKEVLEELKGKIPYVLDGGKCSVGIESTIVGFFDNKVKILRPGYISRKQIENVLKKNVELASEVQGKVLSPGQLKSHYAPITKLYLCEDVNLFRNKKNIGVLDFSKYNSLKEIALNLFSDIRKLDRRGYKFIVSELVQNRGIGEAINDRLLRASSGFIKVSKGKLTFVKK
ncbi:MAG: L-threonylcarbamoyladenylate synthase [Ignavibacteria bacterium]